MHRPRLQCFLILLAALILLWVTSGCASTLEVRQSRETCVVRGEINTGTTIACSPAGVAVERRSVKDTAEVVLPAAVQGLLRWALP